MKSRLKFKFIAYLRVSIPCKSANFSHSALIRIRRPTMVQNESFTKAWRPYLNYCSGILKFTLNITRGSGVAEKLV